MNPWESPALRKTAEARTPSSSSLEKLLPEKRKCLFISLLRIERSHLDRTAVPHIARCACRQFRCPQTSRLCKTRHCACKGRQSAGEARMHKHIKHSKREIKAD